MRKKILKTLAAIMAATLCLGMTAFAAPSPDASSFVYRGIQGARDASGNDISSALSVNTSFTSAEQAAVTQVRSASGLQAVLGSDYNENMVVADVRNVTVTGNVTFPVTLTFSVNGVTASTRAQILHYANGQWEKIATTAGEGTLTGTFSSLSPVAFVVDATTLKAGASASATTGSTTGSATSSTSTSGSKTSPKTNAATTTAVAVLGLCAVVAVCGLKKKEY